MAVTSDESQHLTEEQRAEYVDGRMAPAIRQAAERHVQACALCQRSVEQEREVAALLRRMPSLDPPRSFTLSGSEVGQAWARAAAWTRVASGLAAAFLVVLLAVDLLGPRPTAAPAPMAAVDTAARAKPAQESRLAAKVASKPAAASAPEPARPDAQSEGALGAHQPAPTAAPALAPEERPAAAAAPQTAPAAKPAELPAAAPAPPRQAAALEADKAESAADAGMQAMSTPTPLASDDARPALTAGLREWQVLAASLALVLAAFSLVLSRRARRG